MTVLCKCATLTKDSSPLWLSKDELLRNPELVLEMIDQASFLGETVRVTCGGSGLTLLQVQLKLHRSTILSPRFHKIPSPDTISRYHLQSVGSTKVDNSSCDRDENRRRKDRGDMYFAFTPDLIEERKRCRVATGKFNKAPDDISRREAVEMWKEYVFLIDFLIIAYHRNQRKVLLKRKTTWQHQLRHDAASPSGHYCRGRRRAFSGLAVDRKSHPSRLWLQCEVIKTPSLQTRNSWPLADSLFSLERLGKGTFVNHTSTWIDTCPIEIGARTLIGPNCSFFSGGHPLDPELRNGTRGPEDGKPIRVGDDCWFGGSCIVLQGVNIGRGVTVGAGSVVTKDVPDNVVVAGNPARIIRRLEGCANA